MLPMNISGRNRREAVDTNEIAPDANERARRANVIRLGILFVFALTMIDISTLPQRSASTTASSISSTNDIKSDRINAQAYGEENGNGSFRATDFINLVNGLTAEQSEAIKSKKGDDALIPHNVTGLYRGEWKSPDHKFQSGIIPAHPAYSVGVNGEAAKRALLPSSGRLLLNIKSSEIPGLNDISFVYGVARMFKAGLRELDTILPLKGVFLKSNGELILMTSYDSNERLYLEVPLPLKKNGKGALKARHSQRRRRLSHAEAAPLRPPWATPSRGLLRRSLANLLDFNFFERKENRDLSVDMVLKELGGPLEGEAKREGEMRRRRLRTQVSLRGPGAQTLVQEGQSKVSNTTSRNRTVSYVQIFPFQLGHERARLVVTRMLVPTSGSAHNASAAASMPAPSVTPTALSTTPRSTAIAELGVGEVTATFKQLQAVLASATMQARSPVCPVTMNIFIDTIRKEDARSNVPLVPITSSNSITGQPQATATLNPDMMDSEKKGTDSFAEGITGAIVSGPCGLNMTMEASSYFLDVGALKHKAALYSLMASTMCALQIWLLVLQMRYAQTPAITSRMSILSVCANSVLDALISVGHLMLSASVPGMFLQNFMWISILKLLFFCVFEMRTIVSIYQARFSSELTNEGWSGLRQRLASLHLRFYAAVFVCMFLTLGLSDRPLLLVFLLYSMWVPQIAYSAYSGTKRALLPAYIAGTSATRLFIPLYFYGCPENLLHSVMLDETLKTAPGPCVVLVLWLGLQVGLVLLQDRWGPRFFLPKSWFPQRYDYFRPIPQSVLEVPAKEDRGDGEESEELVLQAPDCVICYNKVPESYGAYMIAPCDHLFCKDCLVHWMEIKGECPVCRAELPVPDDEE